VSARDLDDPKPWRHAEPGQGVAGEIGAAIRALGEPAAPDDLRLAHIRQRVSARARGGERRAAGARVRLWALAVACVLLGSTLTAVAGWAYIRRERAARAVAARAARPARAEGPASPGPPRRWHVRVEAPARLDVTVGERGAEIAVADGQAEVAGVSLPAPVRLARGEAWRESDPPHRAARAPAPLLAPAPAAVPAPAPSPAEPPPARRIAMAAAGAAPPSAPPSAVAPPAIPAPAPPATEPLPAGDAPAPPPPSSPASEAASLGEALRLLRQQGDARGALARLEAHAIRYPAGTLAREAALARSEALLALGRSTAALEVLDGLSLSGAAERGVTLARAELRAAARRCGEAEDDFSRVLATSADDEDAARALYGRGACRLRRGDATAARADFQAYAVRFPDGPRRAEVARALARIGR
jgi:TolA-binding protein